MSNFTDFIGGASEITTRTITGTDVTIDGDALYQYWNLTGFSKWDFGTWGEGETVNLYIKSNGNTLIHPTEPASNIDPFGSSTSSSNTVGSGTIDYPLANEQDVFFVFVAGDTETPAVSGFTNTGQTFNYTGFNCGLFYKIADGTETGSFSYTGDVAICFVYKGSVSDIAGFSTATGTSGNPNPPAINVTAGNYVLVLGLLADDGAVLSYDEEPFINDNILGSVATDDDVSMYLGYGNVSSTGSLDLDSMTGGSDTWLAAVLEVPSAPAPVIEWFAGNVPVLSSTRITRLEITKVQNDYYGKSLGSFD